MSVKDQMIVLETDVQEISVHLEKIAKDAQGDFARTSEGVANSQRILTARFENQKAALGEKLLPVQKQLLEVGGDLVEILGEFVPVLEAGGRGAAALTEFLVENRKVIVSLVTAYAAYRAGIKGVEYAKKIIELGRYLAGLVALTGATTAETVALAKNSAAQSANATARTANAAAAGKATGGRLAAALTKSLGSPVGSAILKKLFLPAAVAAAGFAVGKLLGSSIAEAQESRRQAALDSLEKPYREILRSTFEQVRASRTLADTEEARAEIARELLRLKEHEAKLTDEAELATLRHTRAVLEQRSAAADIQRERGLALDREREILAEKKRQIEADRTQLRFAEARRQRAEKQLALQRQINDARQERITGLRRESIAAQRATLPDESQLAIFQRQLTRVYQSAQKNAGDGGETPLETPTDLFNRAEKAQADGDLLKAERLLTRLREVQELNLKIKSLQDSIASSAEAELATRQALADETARQQKELADQEKTRKTALRNEAEQITILRLQAAGRDAEAQALQEEIRLRREATRLAEETGLTEENALRILREKHRLQKAGQTVNGRPAGLDNRFDEEGKRKLARDGRRKKIVLIRRDAQGRRIDSAASSNLTASRRAKAQTKHPLLAKQEELVGLTERLVERFENLTTSS